MRKYKPEQIVTLLRQVEVELANGKTTPQACKEAEITAQTKSVRKLLSQALLLSALTGQPGWEPPHRTSDRWETVSGFCLETGRRTVRI
jgi:hypothetical protein